MKRKCKELKKLVLNVRSQSFFCHLIASVIVCVLPLDCVRFALCPANLVCFDFSLQVIVVLLLPRLYESIDGPMDVTEAQTQHRTLLLMLKADKKSPK